MLSAILQSIIISSFAYLAYLLMKFRDRAVGTSKRKNPLFPEIRGWPLLGYLPQSILDADRPLEAAAILATKFGTGLSITVPGLRIIDISKPEWIEYVQKTNFENYVKGSFFESRMVDLFGLSTLVSDKATWKRSRLVISRIFHVNTFVEIIEPSTNRSMSDLLRLLKISADENRGLDFCNLFSRFNLELFVKMTFGRDLGLFEPEPQPSAESFSKAFDFSQKEMDFRFDALKGWELYEKLSGVGSQMHSSCRIIHDYALTSIDERLSTIVQDDFTEEEAFQQDFLGRIMAAHHHQGHTLNREELRDDTLSFLFAGRDATAQSLSWCFFHLLMNPDIISKIREESSLISGSGQDGQGIVTHENYKQFIVTNAAILEAIRLHPAVPKNMKFAVADDKIPNGPVIEAGDCLLWSDWQMARDPEIWGPDCGQFRPDRWINESGKIRNFGNFKFHAFNGGPRLCVGMNMSILIAVKAIVGILQNFDLEFCEEWLKNVPKSEELEGVKTHYSSPQYQPSMTLPMKNPMMISVKPRSAPKV